MKTRKILYLSALVLIFILAFSTKPLFRKIERLVQGTSEYKEDAAAQFRLGAMYYYGEGVAQDKREAAKWFRKAAEQGLAEAQFGLGMVCYHGDGVAQDVREAAKWFRKAGEQGYVDAQVSLGVMYGNGEGVAQDKREAAKWFRKAAEQGHLDAKSRLRDLEEASKHP